MAEYKTLLYEERNEVAWITLNRPERNNSFDQTMRAELKSVWKMLRLRSDIGCVVLTGAGDKAFCAGIDRIDSIRDGYELEAPEVGYPGFQGNPWSFDDPGDSLGPKGNGLWIPVIVAVNGIACGGAFYMLGEAEFIIASDNATFFDPHVTYGMVAAYEPIHLMNKAPFQEVMRMSLLGSNERMSAARAREVGLVSEVCALEDLHETVAWAAERIAAAPRNAVVGTVRALWMGLRVGNLDALDLAPLVLRVGTERDNIREGQDDFVAHKRTEYRVR